MISSWVNLRRNNPLYPKSFFLNDGACISTSAYQPQQSCAQEQHGGGRETGELEGKGFL